MSAGELRVTAIADLPEFEPGMRVGEEIAARAELEDGDVVVISQKIVSKAEGQVRQLASVTPGPEARQLASKLDKDPALVELILTETREVLRAERSVLIVETHHGFVCANAGIDTSNLPDPNTVCLLPQDPDASARRIREEIRMALAGDPDMGVAGHSPLLSADPHTRPSPTLAVVIADSFGRAWRLGQAEVAIGCAGLTPLDDWRGRRDAQGRQLEATAIAIADEAAAAADLVRNKASGGPAAIVRGIALHVTADDGPGAAALRRQRDEDLFR